MNTIEKKEGTPLLSIYFTAGYPTLDSTISIAKKLEEAGADFLEIGFPYSDPVADGPVIQHSSEIALENGMTLEKLFDQLNDLREHISIPVFLMGYFNPVLQFGVEKFCEACKNVGVAGAIIPDLPMDEYEDFYKGTFEKNGVANVFIVTPQTSTERIRKIDSLSRSFIYLLSSNATTGKTLDVGDNTAAYFKRVNDLHLKNPLIVGFGISDKTTFQKATRDTAGAIIGTAFVKRLKDQDYLNQIPAFISSIKA
ncbi:tryptophan synthase subunit alpha [Sphingobacterium zeae]|uniref:Tryptophan synthase alpha chain n=1 Tax=Sphingobacterium zeae TaxID=1776859 RepID=A0ABU0UBN9_9SPHI|nr:tryptophan synthase subunit alpha [Sphingobacterium zeae]MDQ1152260.1 tryptophan synthase alpha chain [Sphingobacterium zeae]